jgi:GTP-binding protein EngB required for normal cell division
MVDSPVDSEALKWLTGFEIPLLVVATKGDKLGKEKSRQALKEIAKRHGLPQQPILTSADAKLGRDGVLEQLEILLQAPKKTNS